MDNLLHVPQYHTTVKVKCYIKHYPTFSKLISYHTPITAKIAGYELDSKSGSVLTASSSPIDSIEESLRRTKTTISDLVLCNEFDYFATFTFSPKFTDRYDINSCKTKMSKWLNNQRDIHGKFKYLIVPERHKDGALHFHALLKNYTGNIKLTPYKTNSNRTIYNISSYKLGHSTLTPIDNHDKVSSYIKKYITKEMVTFPGKKRYWCSDFLNRPLVIQNPEINPWTLKEFSTTYQGEGFDILIRQGKLTPLLKNGEPQWPQIEQLLLT